MLGGFFLPFYMYDLELVLGKSSREASGNYHLVGIVGLLINQEVET